MLAAAASRVAARIFTARIFTARAFSVGKRPDWMVQAELDSVASVAARAAKGGSVNDRLMNQLTHEFDSERVRNTVNMEDRLKQLLIKLNGARPGAVDDRGRKLYNAIRKRCLDSRQELITQRESAGLGKDAAGIVEQMFFIPAAV
jgi:hypothetical protein